MQNRLFSIEHNNKQQQLLEALQTYQTLANSNPAVLRSLIPSEEMWRFFVEDLIQKQGRGFKKLPYFRTHYAKFLHLTVKDYLTFEKDYYKKAMEERRTNAAMDIDDDAFKTFWKEIRLQDNLEKKYLSKFLYEPFCSRFTLNDLILFDNGLAVFELNEPNYFKSLYNAFDNLFCANHPADLLTTIKQYHALATTDVLKKEEVGCFRQYWSTTFRLIYGKNCSREGLTAIINNNRKYLSFKVVELGVGGRHIACDKANIDELLAIINNPKFTLHLESESTSYWDVNDTIEKKLLVIIQQYENSVKIANNPLEKLKAIVLFIQHCEQLHPFSDGNCRTICMLLLNHLLIQNGFPLAILSDPNKFDSFSPDQLVNEVIQGMRNVFELICTRQLFNVTTASMIDDLRKIKQPEVTQMLTYFETLNNMEKSNRERLMSSSGCIGLAQHT